jgi:long-chain acyl-CoA synthetase
VPHERWWAKAQHGEQRTAQRCQPKSVLQGDGLSNMHEPRAQLNTLSDVIDALAGYGKRPAIRTPGRPDALQWSYARLSKHVRRLACGLIARGARPGASVALLAGARAEWFVACLAIIAAGAVVVPVDEQLSDEVLKHVLEDSASRIVFTTSETVQRLVRLDLQIEVILLDAADDPQHGWRRMLADGMDLPKVGQGDVAALFYTSGTTGPPKGVPLTHANLIFQINALIAAELLTTHDRVLLPLPLHHVYPFVIGLLLPLSVGLPVILPQALTGPRIVEAIRNEAVTAIVGVPRLYSVLYAGIEAQARGRGRLAGAIFAVSSTLCTGLRRRFGLRAGRLLLRPLHRQFGPSLRILACGGSALDPELGFRLEGLGWQLAIGYGLTETAPLLTIDPPGKVRMGSVGLPVPGVELRIDPSAYPGEMGTARRHDRGEILARGPNVFGGYRNLPQQTAEAFTTDGFFRTGDLGHFDADDYLYVTGRISTLIVTSGGENVQPDEIEAVYLKAPIIREIGVLQQDEHLVAVIVPELEATDDRSPEGVAAAVRAAVDRGSKELASYKRISHYIITPESLPRTRLGKIQRHLLKIRYAQALREGTGAAGALAVEEMSDQDQALLEDPTARQVWAWLSQRYPDVRLSPDSNLQLDLGIDSLAWLNLTMELGSRFKLELSEQATARIKTVRDLLSEISGGAESRGGITYAEPLYNPEQVLTEAQRHWLEPQATVMQMLANGSYYLNRAVMKGLFRARARGLEHLPTRTPYVIAPNHASYLDAFAIASVLELARMRQTYWAGWAGVAFNSRFKRAFSRVAHVLPIEQGRAASSSLAFGAAVLSRKQNLAWFPEGERSAGGELMSFKPGLGILLDHFQVPVVPVYIQGSFEALPKSRLWPRFVPITVVFGRSCHPRELAAEGEGSQPYERIVNALRARIVTLRDQASTATGCG